MLAKIDGIFRHQEKVLTQTTVGFDFEDAVRQLRQNLHAFGAPENHRAVVQTSVWPIFETLKMDGLEQFEQ